ncbi:hypothetical protein SK224_01210 [Microbacterium sp. BG28]|uniref:hypothetical protein n=1 Tax=Microbacterium sp. BG28 TaxID=3097356 RepID=UPI002A59883B|nr:hypothetical protein [Microbacterium sp. BG28]MDY0827736.1 hypothetical protein [Microbacterium sp. BG28]
MSDVLGWGTIVLVLSIPLLFVLVSVSTHRRQRSDGADAGSSGGLLGFDELFHPSAHEARLVWEAEQEIPVPAPTPDKGHGVIEGGSRITIEVPGASSGAPRPTDTTDG